MEQIIMDERGQEGMERAQEDLRMKVVTILGSPRKNGTGTKVAEEIEHALSDLGDVEFERIHLVDLDLCPCRGCFTCIRSGEDRCPLKDDRPKIEKKLEEADGIIIISPGYVQNVSGLMKNFMDRMAFTHHRPRFFKKKMMIVANGGAGLDKTLDALRIALGGPTVVSEIAYMQLPWPTSPRSHAKRKAIMGREIVRFHKALTKKDLRPSLNEYMRFKFFKNASVEARDWLPADYEFYRDKEGYYYDVKVGTLTKLLAAMSMAIAKHLMKDMAPWQEGTALSIGPQEK